MITLAPPAGFVLPDEETRVPHTHTCPDCQHEHESLFRGTSAVCPDCLVKRQEALRQTEKEADDKLAQATRVTAWESMCAPDYRRTDWGQHPELSAACRWLARHWRMKGEGRPEQMRAAFPLKAEEDALFGTERGLLIYGPTGRGKTRAMFGILRGLHFSGVPCAVVEAVTFAEMAARAADLRAPWAIKKEAQDFLWSAKHARVLFFDDLGKEGSMPHFARAFHDLLEHRKKHHLPILVTSERVGDELAQHLGTNYADGIVRRLREICAVFSTEDDQPSE